jgi:hypothetical protein
MVSGVFRFAVGAGSGAALNISPKPGWGLQRHPLLVLVGQAIGTFAPSLGNCDAGPFRIRTNPNNEDEGGPP